MPSQYVDRLATIAEDPDYSEAEAGSPGKPDHDIVRMAKILPGGNVYLDTVVSFIKAISAGVLFPFLQIAHMTELFRYLALLVYTSACENGTIGQKLFAVGQICEMSKWPARADECVADCQGSILLDLVTAIILFFLTPPHRPNRHPDNIYIAKGEDLPGIDLIVTCCGEEVDVIMDTVKACLDLDYPKGKLRVIISDDGKNADLRNAVSTLSYVFNNMVYFTRDKDPNKHHGFKAGNINTCLKLLGEDGMNPNPWICNLDCDMIPDRNMLRVLIAPALKDAAVGLVTLPQVCWSMLRYVFDADLTLEGLLQHPSQRSFASESRHPAPEGPAE
jgi:hypothetical protein